MDEMTTVSSKFVDCTRAAFHGATVLSHPLTAQAAKSCLDAHETLSEVRTAIADDVAPQR